MCVVLYIFRQDTTKSEFIVCTYIVMAVLSNMDIVKRKIYGFANMF